MDRVFDAIVLGLVQGLTEFLPVSSSGHLALFQALLDWENPAENVAFNIAVHVGSLGAVLVFVRREIVAMFTTRRRLLFVLAAATAPLVGVALLGAKDLVAQLSSSLLAVGVFLCATGGILALAKRMGDGEGEASRLAFGGAFLVGFAQVWAILPGISRSGTTLVASMGVGLSREESVRFAFLLAAPAIGGAGLLELLGGEFGGGLPHAALAAGTLVSFAASLVAMKVMVGVVARRRLGWFAAYCVAIGLLAIGLALAS